MSDRADVYVESCGCCIVIGKGDTELAFVDIGHEARAALEEVLARHAAAEQRTAALEARLVAYAQHCSWVDGSDHLSVPSKYLTSEERADLRKLINISPVA